MDWGTAIYVLLLLAALINLCIARYAWMRRSVPAAMPFALVMVAAVVWELGDLATLQSSGETAKIFWIKVQYIGITLLPPTLLVFTLAFTQNRRPLKWPLILLLLFEPFIALLLLWTNPYHHLFWRELAVRPVGTLQTVVGDHAIGFWIHLTYSYGLILLSFCLLARFALSARRLYRFQAMTVLLGVVVPWLTNALFILRPHTFGHLDPTPFSFVITGLILAWGLFRFGLLNIVPIAHSTVVHHLDDPVITLDLRHRILDLNPAAQNLLRVGARFLGRPLVEATAHVPEVMQQLQSILEQPDGDEKEVVLERDRERTVYALRVIHLYDLQEQPQGLSVVCHDITAYQESAELMRRNQVALETTVAKMQDLDQLKSAFLSSINHELRTPVTSLTFYLSLLADGRPEKRDEYLKMARQECTRLQQLVDSALDTARLDLEGNDRPQASVDLNAVVDEVLERHRGQIEGVKLNYKRDGSAFVKGEYVQLVKALGHLVDNAIQFSPSDGTVSIRLYRSDDYVCLEVQDAGPGIPPDEQEYIFDRFYRGEQVRETDQSGAGLGLSIVEQIVSAQGGSIDVESEPQQGTVFTLRFPRAGE